MAHRPIKRLLLPLASPIEGPIPCRLCEPKVASFERRVPAAKNVHRLVPLAHPPPGGDFLGDEDVLPNNVVTRGGPDAHRVPIVLDLDTWRLDREIEGQENRTVRRVLVARGLDEKIRR